MNALPWARPRQPFPRHARDEIPSYVGCAKLAAVDVMLPSIATASAGIPDARWKDFICINIGKSQKPSPRQAVLCRADSGLCNRYPGVTIGGVASMAR